MPKINQSAIRSFDQRTRDFGPELGAFLRRAWAKRTLVNISDYKQGSNTLYGFYSGNSRLRRFNLDELKQFIKVLKKAAGRNRISCQILQKLLTDLSDAEIEVNCHVLWQEFYHVVHKSTGQKTVARAYVHAANAYAALKLMESMITRFGRYKGFWEVKTAGPGATRLDTIVAYFYDYESRDAMIEYLKSGVSKYPGLFADSLPPLVKREARGIGSAGEPPAVQVLKGERDRFSFGSFWATLIWVAFKATPDFATKADGRHMLDNLLYSMRLLGIDPGNPQTFPEKDRLETWWKTVKVREASVEKMALMLHNRARLVTNQPPPPPADSQPKSKLHRYAPRAVG